MAFFARFVRTSGRFASPGRAALVAATPVALVAPTVAKAEGSNATYALAAGAALLGYTAYNADAKCNAQEQRLGALEVSAAKKESCAFVFVRTSHLSAAFVCHAFCNYMGLPDLDFAAKPEDLPWLSAREKQVQIHLHKHRVVLYGAHLAGIALFALLLFPITSPAYFHSPFWPLAP